MIGRRQFIAGLGSAVAWPLVAWAQQGDRVLTGTRFITTIAPWHFDAGSRHRPPHHNRPPALQKKY
jgi:hypothetical protein